MSLDGNRKPIILTEIERKYSKVLEVDHLKPVSVYHQVSRGEWLWIHWRQVACKTLMVGYLNVSKRA